LIEAVATRGVADLLADTKEIDVASSLANKGFRIEGHAPDRVVFGWGDELYTVHVDLDASTATVLDAPESDDDSTADERARAVLESFLLRRMAAR